MNLDRLSPDELRTLITDALTELAARADPAAFAELIGLHRALGEALGKSARVIAGSGSWARVADLAGTTRQAAWSRWRLPDHE